MERGGAVPGILVQDDPAPLVEAQMELQPVQAVWVATSRAVVLVMVI